MLKVTTNYIPIGHPNRPGIKMTSKPKARICHGTSNYNKGTGDEMHQSYVGRAYTKKWNQKLGKYEYFEANREPFRFGCTHVYIDKDSATIVVPLDEYCPGAGDRPLPYDEIYKGQKPLAKQLFNNQQNYCTWQYELCMNDMNAWEQVLLNAIDFFKTYMPGTDIPDVRHYDVTGKQCPIPFVNLAIKEVDPRWVSFSDRVKTALTTPKEMTVSEAIDIWEAAGIIMDPAGMKNDFVTGSFRPDRYSAFMIKSANYINERER